MARIPFIVLCAAWLVCAVPNYVNADRLVYDTPIDPRLAVGDDDEPFITAHATQPARHVASTQGPQDSSHWLSRVLQQITEGKVRVVALFHANRGRLGANAHSAAARLMPVTTRH